jgi:hypothetical protein
MTLDLNIPRTRVASIAALLAASGVHAGVITVTGAGSSESFSDMADAIAWVSDASRSMNQYDVHVTGSFNSVAAFDLPSNVSLGWGDSPGILEVLGTRQTSINLNGGLNLEMAGTNNAGAFGVQRAPVQYDTILALDAKSVKVGGVVTITLLNSFVPVLGNSFEVVATNSTINWSGSVNGPALAGGLIWVSSVATGRYGGDSLYLTVSQGFNVPAPSAIALVGCCGMFTRRRRLG